MADTDPMEGGRTVRLSLHRAQVDYLVDVLGNFITGLEDDVAGHPNDPNVELWRAEAEAFGRLDQGLARGQVVVVDPEIERLVRRWAATNDRAEEFHRVLFEHQTLASLREQIEAEA